MNCGSVTLLRTGWLKNSPVDNVMQSEWEGKTLLTAVLNELREGFITSFMAEQDITVHSVVYTPVEGSSCQAHFTTCITLTVLSLLHTKPCLGISISISRFLISYPHNRLSPTVPTQMFKATNQVRTCWKMISKTQSLSLI